MNTIERVKMVKAMEYIARQVNDELVFNTWLIEGVADGDLDYGEQIKITRRGGYDGRKVYYYDNIYTNSRPCAAYAGGNKRGNCAAGVALSK